MSRLIDGKAVARPICGARVAEAVELLADRDISPGLATVLVGDDPASRVYVRNKIRACAEAGIRSIEHAPDADISEAALLDLVTRLNADPEVDGILVQLPLPAGIDAARITEAIDPLKDVDGFHTTNAGRLSAGLEAMVPCTPAGCMILLRTVPPGSERAPRNRRRPVQHRRQAGGAAPARRPLHGDDRPFAHRRPGRALPRGRHPDRRHRPGAHDQGRLDRPPARRSSTWGSTGSRGRTARACWWADVDFEAAKEVAGAITPVPGGVGPMTIACLLRNTAIAACRRRGMEIPEAIPPA